MARCSTPFPLETFRAFLTVSHLSLSELARRFGLSRSNLMGLLSGLRTVGPDKVDQLLSWSGVEPMVGSGLGLLPGLHFWRIASTRELDSFLFLQNLLFPTTDPSVASELILDLPLPDESWVHLLVHLAGDRHLLISSRPEFFRLLQDRWPVLSRPQKVQCFRPPFTLSKLVAEIGVTTALYRPVTALQETFSPIGLVGNTVAARVADWAARARQHLRLDLENCLTADDQIIPSQEASRTDFPDGPPNPELPKSRDRTDTLPASTDDACTQARQLLTRRLDIGGGTHPGVCDIPLFLLEGNHDYPVGMVRLDQAFLGSERLAMGKAQQLRFYQSQPGDATAVSWLVAMTGTAHLCSFPAPLEEGQRRNTGHYLVKRQGQLLVTNLVEDRDMRIGVVVGRFEGFPVQNEG